MVDLVDTKTNSVGGLGFASLDPENTMNLEGSILPGDLPLPDKLPQQAQPRLPGLPGPQTFGQRFGDNPLSTLGFLFQSIAAGIRGTPDPVSAEQDRRQRLQNAHANLIDNVFSTIKQMGEAIQDLPADQADQARQVASQVIAQMTGDQEGAQGLVDTFIEQPGQFDQLLEAEGLGQAATFLGLQNLSLSEMTEIISDPERRQTLTQVADNLHLDEATSKLRFAFGIFDKMKGSEAIRQIPGSSGTALDDLNSVFDARGNFTGTQAELFGLLEDLSTGDGPLFTKGEIGALRRHPEIIQSLTGAKSPKTLQAEQTAQAGGDAPFLLAETDEAGSVVQGTTQMFDLNAPDATQAINAALRANPRLSVVTAAQTTGSVERGASDKTIQGIEQSLLDTEEGLIRLNNIQNSVDDRFLRTGGRFGAAITSLQEKLSDTPLSGLVGRATPEEREFLAAFSEFKQQSIENINLYIKQITGAQMSEAEANRLRQAMPDPGEGIFDGDDPVSFRAKLNAVLDGLNAARKRAQFALENQRNPFDLNLNTFSDEPRQEDTDEEVLQFDEFGRPVGGEG